MIKTRTATVVYDPLDVVFDVVVNGSGLQTFEVSERKYSPNLNITPLMFTPTLQVTDPSHVIVGGDYTKDLTNVRYYADVADENHRLHTAESIIVYDDGRMRWGNNITADSSINIICRASFIDPRRGEVLQFEKTIPLSCCSTDDCNLRIAIDGGKLFKFTPYAEQQKKWFTVAVYNGKEEISVAEGALKWEVVGEHHYASNSDLWFVESDHVSICIDTRYIDKLTLKAVYTHPTNGKKAEALLRIQRQYGQYDERAEIPRGSIVTPNTTETVFRTVVAKRNGGNITNPQKYFDITMAWKRNMPGERWKILGYGPEKKVPISDIKPKYGIDTVFGTQVRELSELRPATVNGKTVMINGKVACVRVPIISSDFI